MALAHCSLQPSKRTSLLSSPCRLCGTAVIPTHTAWACGCCALMPCLSHVARCHCPGQPCHHWADPDRSMYFAQTSSQPSHVSSECCQSSVKCLSPPPPPPAGCNIPSIHRVCTQACSLCSYKGGSMIKHSQYHGSCSHHAMHVPYASS